MMSVTRRFVPRGRWVAVSAVVVLSTLVSAQHPVAPAVHAPAAPVHVYSPPVYHAPVMQTPVMRPPAIYTPAYGLPRTTTLPSAGIPRTTIVLPPVRPVRPVRPIPPYPPLFFVYSPAFLYGGAFSPFDLCWWSGCGWFWPWTLGYTTVSSPGPTNYVVQASETTVYVYGGEREDFPQLYLKDGTVFNVTDYWVVDNQLHFTMIEEIGAKSVEHSIPFEELDLQKSIDANTARGFRFLLRNEPFEQYMRDHPEGPPEDLTPPHR